MAVYFDYQVQSLYDDVDHTVLSWHKNFPLLAVATVSSDEQKGTISFHLDEVRL